MLRGTLAAALAVTATAVVAPAAAKPAPYTVWELSRVSAGGPDEISFRFTTKGNGSPQALLFAHLRPEGRGYASQQVTLGIFGLGDTRWRTYGWPAQAPVPPPGCPTAIGCGSAADQATIDVIYSFMPGAGHRYLVAGPTAHTKVMPQSKHWRARKTTLGLRTRLAHETDATGQVTDAGTVEHFRSASLPGGAYGSEVFAEVPCDVGEWSLSAGTTGVDGGVCVPREYAFTFASGQARTTWNLTGDTVGTTDQPIRMLVLDYPKR